MKKATALALALILTLTLAACGNKGNNNTAPTASNNNPAATAQPSQNKTPDVGEEQSSAEYGYSIVVEFNTEARETNLYSGKALTSQGTIVPVSYVAGTYGWGKPGAILVNEGDISQEIDETLIFQQKHILDPSLLVSNGVQYNIADDVLCVVATGSDIVFLSLEDFKSSEYAEANFCGYVDGNQFVAIVVDRGITERTGLLKTWYRVVDKNGNVIFEAEESAAASVIYGIQNDGKENILTQTGEIMSVDYVLDFQFGMQGNDGAVVRIHDILTDEEIEALTDHDNPFAEPPVKAQAEEIVPVDSVYQKDFEKSADGYAVHSYVSGGQTYPLSSDIACFAELDPTGAGIGNGKYAVVTVEELLQEKYKLYNFAIFVTGDEVVAIRARAHY